MNTVFKSAALLPFETLINGHLKANAGFKELLAQCRGKSLQIEITRPQTAIHMQFYDDTVGLRFVHSGEVKHDSKISGSAFQLTGLLLQPDNSESLSARGVQISGDIEMVQSLQRALADQRIDWQQPLANVIGDVPTHLLDQALEKLGNFARSSRKAVIRNIDEYLHEEAGFMPPVNQLEIIADDLQSLDLRLDRLTARYQQAKRTLATVENAGNPRNEEDAAP